MDHDIAFHGWRPRPSRTRLDYARQDQRRTVGSLGRRHIRYRYVFPRIASAVLPTTTDVYGPGRYLSVTPPRAADLWSDRRRVQDHGETVCCPMIYSGDTVRLFVCHVLLSVGNPHEAGSTGMWHAVGYMVNECLRCQCAARQNWIGRSTSL
ncbi:hypothetical protein OH77DRAFT_345735 [Trametes cingulata]|nr:hypothetical protein OH77DRAFT_345735 [Trametes cingulata]